MIRGIADARLVCECLQFEKRVGVEWYIGLGSGAFRDSVAPGWVDC